MQLFSMATRVLFGLTLAPLLAAAVQQQRSQFAERLFSHRGVIVPLKFKQQLLVCNAYPSDSPVVMQKNGRESVVTADKPLRFQECRYLDAHVQSRDRLDVALPEADIQSTFEVGSLPSTDALLLLVLERDARSPKVVFQSFAFPAHGAGRKDAQLAVINAFEGSAGNSSAPHLKVQDHIQKKEKETVAKRVETLNFNRVYTVEEGGYDVSITDPHRAGANDQELEHRTAKSLQLKQSSNYVILRTGGGKYKESLVVFPDDPLLRSGSVCCAPLALAGLLLSLAWSSSA